MDASQLVCAVANCSFLAESSLDDGEDRFFICALHDSNLVRNLLEEGKRPGSYWSADGFPIVIPVGVLEPKHLEPLAAPAGVIRACDCPHLAAVPAGHSRIAHVSFDLTRSS